MKLQKSKYKEIALKAFELVWEELQYNLNTSDDFSRVIELIYDLRIESENLDMPEMMRAYDDVFFETEFWIYPSAKELENMNCLSDLIYEFADTECRLIKGIVKDTEGKEHTTYFICTDYCDYDENEFLKNKTLEHCEFCDIEDVTEVESTLLKFEDVVYILEKLQEKNSYKDGNFDNSIFERLLKGEAKDEQ